MSAHVVVSCDGHHEGQRCVAQQHRSTRHAPTALADARSAGWTFRRGVGDLCPSPTGHDEDGTR